MARAGPWNTQLTEGGAAQPADQGSRHVDYMFGNELIPCGKLSLCSFNFGMQQTQLNTARSWTPIARKMVLMLMKMFNQADIIFGCELGGHRLGFEKSNADLGNVVAEAATGATFNTCGAYGTFNQRDHIRLVENNSWDVPSGAGGDQEAHMKYDIFVIDFGGTAVDGASQPVRGSCHFVVGNLHVRTPSGVRVSVTTRRKHVTACLDHLSTLQVIHDDQPVIRCLVGDFNLSEQEVLGATQAARPCAAYSSVQRRHGLHQWAAQASHHGRSGDVMLCAGALVQQMTIPIGCSYDDRGMRSDCHDVVGAELFVPLAGGPPQRASPAPSGASQPAASTSGSSRDAAGRDAAMKRIDVQRGLFPTSESAARPISSILRGRSADKEASDVGASAGCAPQLAMPPPSFTSGGTMSGGALQPAVSRPGSPIDRGLPLTHINDRPRHRSRSSDSEASSKRAKSCRSMSVDFDGDSVSEPHLAEATNLVSSIQRAVDAESENDDDEVHRELGRIIFMKRTVEQNGCKVTYVATVAEVIAVVQVLLRRRDRFLQQNFLPPDHAMTPQQRAAIIGLWKAEYNKTPEQVAMQQRDSWKGIDKNTYEKGHGKGQRQGEGQVPDVGPNKDAVRRGKHSRFSCHLQRVGGSKHVAELILFTGCVDPGELRKSLKKAADEHPVVDRGPDEKEALKTAADNAKHRYRSGRLFAERSSKDPKFYKSLSFDDQRLVEEFKNDSLRVRMNEAIIKRGHGTLVHGDGSRLAIGGSTGGLTRRNMDGFKAPTPDEQLEFLRPAIDTRC